jgi:hypothetical protein
LGCCWHTRSTTHTTRCLTCRHPPLQLSCGNANHAPCCLATPAPCKPPSPATAAGHAALDAPIAGATNSVQAAPHTYTPTHSPPSHPPTPTPYPAAPHQQRDIAVGGGQLHQVVQRHNVNGGWGEGGRAHSSSSSSSTGMQQQQHEACSSSSDNLRGLMG